MKYLILFFGVILLSCNPVHTSYNSQIDFKEFKSFCWMNNCTNPFTGPTYLEDSLIQEYVKHAILSEMKAKGFIYSEANPDLIIDFHVTIVDEEVITYHIQENEPNYYRTTFMQPERILLTKGTILIHIVDMKKSELIWQSEASGYLKIPNDLTEKPIRKGVKNLLKEFPPVKISN